jgi:DNA-binding transcriptional MerR regulator
VNTGAGKEGKGRFHPEPLIKKAYYSIGDVCELTGLKPHVLRYWETQFPELAPTKNRAGNRVYRPREVELVLLVKHLLYKERFTIEGARKKLKELRHAGDMDEERREVLAPELLAVFKEELQDLLEVLEAPPSAPSD